MTIRKALACGAIIFAVNLTTSALAQDNKDNNKGRRNQQQQQQQQQQAPAQQNVGPVAQSKDEFDAFMAVQNEQAPAKKVELAEGFIAKYPASDFVMYAQIFRVASYGQLGKPKEAVAAAEQAIDATIKLGEKLGTKADADSKLSDKDKEAIRKKDKNAIFLDKNSPQYKAFMSQSEERILALYQTVISGYQQLNDSAKMMEWGDKALGLKPDDLNTLAMLSNVMAERPPTNEEEKTKQMKRAEELADQALNQLPTYLASPDGANMPAQGKADLTAQLHYTRGLIYLHQKKLGASQQEFLTALKSKPNDPITYYRLGIAYVQDMKADQAMDSLGKSVFLKGVSEANAMDLLKQLYLQKNKSEQGLADYVKSAGAKIGQ
jgi:tetratricopeptide (TPR) repeat protein